MSYALKYTIPFASLKNRSCVVEIEQENYVGESVELTASGSPFTVDIDNEEFLYTPCRFSTAKIGVVGKDYLRTLFSTQYRQHRVTMKMDGQVMWCGYVKPEIYTQDYASETFELEMECMSAMSVLEYIDYSVEGEEKQFVSLWALLKKCVKESMGQYTAVCVPYIYAKSAEEYQAGSNVLDKMVVSEQNFFDEDGKPMKLKEVLEEVCKFLGWTCTDWRGELWFVDMDWTGTYHRYNIDMTEKTDVTVNSLNVQDIGFAGADHSLDILPGYNKVTVRCSNYSVGDLLPDEDFENLETVKTIDDVTDDGKKVCHSKYLKPNQWNCYQYKNGKIVDNNSFDEIKNEIETIRGTTLMKFCVYEKEENLSGELVATITDYTYTEVIRIKYPDSDENLEVKPGWYKSMSFKGASATYSDGAIGISGSVKIIKDDDMIPWYNSAAGYGRTDRAFQLRIGEYYFGNETGSDLIEKFGWSKNNKNIVILNTESWNNDGSLDWVNIPNDKTLEMPYTGIQGFIAPIEEILFGDLEFTLLVNNKAKDVQGTGRGVMAGEMIKDFKIEFVRSEETKTNNENNDRIYENVLNEYYINELDDIELKISSYNNDGACYSKVLCDETYITDNLYNAILNKQMRPENMLISRIISHYSSTRYKLTEEIENNVNLTPATRMSDKFLLDRRFVNCGGTIDFRNEKFSYTMIEV